jgi:hypothetical protein
VSHFRCARRLATDAKDQWYFTHELANALAKQRTPRSLAASRRLYEKALGDVSRIEDAAWRDRSEIALLNGLALVEYVEGADQAALDLEERAQRLAFGLAERQELGLARWAFGLVGLNMAKLLLVRFHDRRRAISTLTTALDMCRPDPKLADKIRRDLARLTFAEQNYAEVSSLLGGLFPSDRLSDLKPWEEFHDRLLLATAQLEQNRPAACREQLLPLRILADRLGGSTAAAALSVLTQAVGPARDVPPPPRTPLVQGAVPGPALASVPAP